MIVFNCIFVCCTRATVIGRWICWVTKVFLQWKIKILTLVKRWLRVNYCSIFINKSLDVFLFWLKLCWINVLLDISKIFTCCIWTIYPNNKFTGVRVPRGTWIILPALKFSTRGIHWQTIMTYDVFILIKWFAYILCLFTGTWTSNLPVLSWHIISLWHFP